MAWTERYVRADAAGGGDGTTNTNSGANGAWTLAEAIAAVSSGQRVNVKAGTYANAATSRTFATAGTTTAPIWWRGFNSTIGDLDSDEVTAKPAITFTTGVVGVTGAHQIFSNLDIVGTGMSGVLVNLQAANIHLDRVRIENQNAATAAYAVACATGQARLTRCWLKATSTATRVAEVSTETSFVGCAFVGGGDGIRISGGALTVADCVFNDVGGHGVNLTAATSRPMSIISNTFYSVGTDGIRLAALPSFAIISHNLITHSGGYGINNSTGTNTNVISRLGNVFYSNTSGNETGFGDSPSLGEGTESTTPYTNAGSGDLSLVTGAVSKGRGLPGAFENQSYTSYLDTGAVQRQESGGGGGLAANPLGGFVR